MEDDDMDDESLSEQERRRRHEEPLDYSPSSGAVGSNEKIYDVTAPGANDERADTETTFYAEEASQSSVDYEHLSKINAGMFAKNSDERERRAGRKHDLSILSTVLDLDERIVTRIRRILSKIDDFRRVQCDEVAVLAATTLVLNRNGRRVRGEQDFMDVCEAWGVSRSEIRAARRKLRDL